MNERHIRNFPAISRANQERLRTLRVCVVGCGGLGGYIIEYFARLGIGSLVLVDGDIFEPSNLNRQLLCTEETLGKLKVDAAAERVGMIDPDIEVIAHDEFLNESNGIAILEHCHLAMDALDNIRSRLLLARFCDHLDIPMIHGAISGWNLQATTCMPKSHRLDNIYHQENIIEADRSSLVFTASLCAAVQTAEGVKVLLGEKSSLEERLLIGNLKEMSFEYIDM
ncbi:MAG: HesA/MoeB/ThiF family protein [Clostridiaceae bacterium]|jgi:molybdopterin/thiamine biosynthesis adenylyltransferase|nr:HesA/MoeB/ThiF family protein [Clostridiaceae bacterium]